MSETVLLNLSEFDPQWKHEYQTEKIELLAVFGDAALEIEHIGSTSVPGLASKPIIDIAVIIAHRENADRFTDALAAKGYALSSNSTERHFYVKRRPRECHLSVAYADQGGFWPRQILFRDYLREHRAAREEYARLKEDLLRRDPSGETYLEGKTDFVYRILELAGWRRGEKYTR
ncbi:MAG: GrpB family protein [Gemmatimonadetes bacterium]|nr:GrpB family protein [Gemmatimonadota bacterium]